MPLPEGDLLDHYGAAVLTNNAALYIGAGLSQPAGYPGWDVLLEPLRREASIPPELKDFPLVAQYYVQSEIGSREKLEEHILAELNKVPATPTPAHHILASLSVPEIWTPNYDPLLEIAMSDALVIHRDEDLGERRKGWVRRVIKMHGSVIRGGKVLRRSQWAWKSSPVITRGDYESYDTVRPRTWSLLRATYLTKSMLFLGFSFSDPNVEVLLRLARTQLESGRPEHFTVMRRPSKEPDLSLHEHLVRDLESSGTGVYVIDDFSEIEPLLGRLFRRTRPPNLFLSGSDPEGTDNSGLCRNIGETLAESDITLNSLAGPTGMQVSYGFGKKRRKMRSYVPDGVQFFFRAKDEEPPPLSERIGTAIYTDRTREQLREEVLSNCRASLIIGGGTNTRAEFEFAKAIGVPAIPVAASGGVARESWDEMRVQLDSLRFGGRPIDSGDFEALAHGDPQVVAAAAGRLIRQAMHLDAP